MLAISKKTKVATVIVSVVDAIFPVIRLVDVSNKKQY